jgi:hypothetical protein
MGASADTILTERRLGDLLRNFEYGIKRTFNPFGPRRVADYEIAIGGVSDIPEIGLEDGYMTFTKYYPFLTVKYQGTRSKVSLIQYFNKF